jgi:hypothetical protein
MAAVTGGRLTEIGVNLQRVRKLCSRAQAGWHYTLRRGGALVANHPWRALSPDACSAMVPSADQTVVAWLRIASRVSAIRVPMCSRA